MVTKQRNIMDEPSSRSRPTHSIASPIGLHSYYFIWIVCAVTAAAVIWVLPPLSFVFGVGLFVSCLVFLLIFLLFILFRRMIFKHLYGKLPNESEAVLIEYFAQQQGQDKEIVSTELIENALHLQEINARDCMAKRSDIVHFPASGTIAQLRHLFAESQHSRIIITENGSLDTVLGYVHVQQMFDEQSDVRKMTMPIQFVPATLPVDELLNRFVRTRTNIAGVSDELGLLTGIVTLENALEQLFGAIEDEHD